MSKSLALLLSLSPMFMTGCGVVRNIEQWKCDNLGMCHFGITPSRPGMQFANPPASAYGEFDGSVITGPQFSGVSEGGSQGCPNCPH